MFTFFMNRTARIHILATGIVLWWPLGHSEETVRVLDSHSIQTGGRTITLERIEPPKIEPVATTAATVSSESAARTFPRFVSLSATVFDHAVTEVRWWHNGGEYVIWSSIDFNHMRSVSAFTDGWANYYALYFGIGNESRELIEKRNAMLAANGLAEVAIQRIPVLPAPPQGATGSYYVVVSAPSGGAERAAFEAIDALHRHYDANKADLIAEYNESEARRVAEEAYRKANPPVPRDSVIRFWPKRRSVSTSRQRGDQ